MIYYYPNTGRGGLGNKLFPWARAVVYQHQFGGKMIAPNWVNVFKIGPYLRQEKDKRHYFNVFNNKGYIKGIKKQYLLLLYKKLPEEALHNKTIAVDDQDNKIIEFKNFVGSGVKPYFEGLHGYSELLINELQRITRKRLIPQKSKTSFIGVHIRMGDFSVPKDLDEIRKANALYYRLPLEWYINAIQQIRLQLKRDIEVLIFSDGSTKDLAQVLNLPNVRLIQGNAAITDLLMLSQASCIIASGSTFSMWAAFLGQKPSVWFTGLRRGHLINNDIAFSLQPEWEDGDFPDNFISNLQQSIKENGN